MAATNEILGRQSGLGGAILPTTKSGDPPNGRLGKIITIRIPSLYHVIP